MMTAWEVRGGRLGRHRVGRPDPSAGDVLVRVTHAGICGTDLPKLEHPAAFTVPDPWRPGHEIAGTDPRGRAVAVDPLVRCGHCAACVVGDTQLCGGLRRLGWDLPGGFAEYVLAPATNVHQLPDGLTPAVAVLADPAAVAIHGLRCHPIGPPGRLAVIGAGAVGLLTATYAHDLGWAVMIGYRSTPAAAIPAAVPVAELPGDFDVVVDAASGAGPAPFDLAMRQVRDGGTIVVQNAYHPGVRAATGLRDLVRRSIRVVGSFSFCRRHQPDDFTLALDLLRRHPVAHWVAEFGADLPAAIKNRPGVARRVLTFGVA